MGKVIAIDGPSGAGKSTIAKLIAREMGFDYLETGALYRVVALELKSKGIDIEANDGKILKVLEKTDISLSNGKVLLNKTDVSEKIRSKEIDYYSSVFSARKVVRDFLLGAQRNAATSNNIVVEGRDTTTVVFPNAWKKIYLDASIDERAKRRYLQFKDKAVYGTPEEAKRDVMERDIRDSDRDLSPLRRTENAFFLDSSNLSLEQTKEKILRFIKTGQ